MPSPSIPPSAPGLNPISALFARTSGQYRYWGAMTVNGTTAANNSRLLKGTAEAPFSRIRLHVGSCGPTKTQWRFAVAATETADVSTQANIGSPIVGGTAQNTLDSITSPYGLRTLTVRGQPFLTFQGLGIAQSGNAAPVPEWVTTDWADVQSVPRADGGTLPLWMVYGDAINAATQAATWINYNSTVQNMSVPTAANRGRILQNFRSSNTTAITAPGTGNFAAVNDMMFFIIEFEFGAAASTIMSIGDSTVQQNVTVADNVSSRGFRRAAIMSTASAPVLNMNTGASSQTSPFYWAQAKRSIIRAQPTAAVFETFSPNDGTLYNYTTDGGIRAAIQAIRGRTVEFIDMCRANRIRPVLDNGLPLGSLAASQAAIRAAYAAEIATLAASANCGFLDSYNFFSSGGATPTIKAQYAYNSDGIHFNEQGSEDSAIYDAPILARVIKNGY